MLRDFAVADAVAIQSRGMYFDLHNDFELAQLGVSVDSRAVELVFVATSRLPNLPGLIALRFLDVDWFQVSPRALCGRSGFIDELGYKDAADTDHDWLLSEAQASAESHFFVRFADDEYVRLHARQANAVW